MNIFPLDIITFIEPTTGLIRFLNDSKTLDIEILPGDTMRKIQPELDFNGEYFFRIISDSLKKKVADLLVLKKIDDNIELVFISINQDYFKNSNSFKIEDFKPVMLDLKDYEQLNLFANWFIYDYADKFEYFHNTYESLPQEIKKVLFELRQDYLSGLITGGEVYNKCLYCINEYLKIEF